MTGEEIVKGAEENIRKGKIPFELGYDDYGEKFYRPVDLTGKIKLVFGGPNRHPGEHTKYYQVRWFFGLFTYWVIESRIEWHEPVSERTYDERV